MRTVYSWKEVCEFLGMPQRSVKNLVERGHLMKRYSGQYPFDQSDVNGFLIRLNAGKIALGRGRR